MARPTIAGPDIPTSPYPITLQGTVTKGFGRGSKELGIPTANMPESVAASITNLDTGIYFGYARVGDTDSYPMVMSFGWNPFYKNEKRSLEVHVIHRYDNDFYGEQLKIVILGFIRAELDYTTKEALIDDINTDIKVALNSLNRAAYSAYSNLEIN